MPDPAADAAAQLRAIRSLMERATVYRAISAPAALGAGALAAVLGLWQYFNPPGSAAVFFWMWVAVFVLASALNTWLLYRGAAARGESFLSAGARHALISLVPPLFCGLALSVLTPVEGNASFLSELAGESRAYPARTAEWMAVIWIIAYGLSLLAVRSFSPRSMHWLGYSFLLAGLTLLAVWTGRDPADACHAPLIMACTFGLFHIIYGLLVLSRRVPHSPPPAE